MEPVTCRWVRAQLTVAQDLFDRQILGLKVTPVSTKAVDVAGVLFEAVTGRGSGRPTLGPVHGLPERLVSTRDTGGRSRQGILVCARDRGMRPAGDLDPARAAAQTNR